MLSNRVVPEEWRKSLNWIQSLRALYCHELYCFPAIDQNTPSIANVIITEMRLQKISILWNCYWIWSAESQNVFMQTLLYIIENIFFFIKVPFEYWCNWGVTSSLQSCFVQAGTTVVTIKNSCSQMVLAQPSYYARFPWL